ncbi:MAG: type 1 glutamine amidotransferase domain-containing protein [Pseudomonadota bacterium]
MTAGNKEKRVVLVMSSVDEMGFSGKQSGTWFTELPAPDYILTEAGYHVVFASPEGGAALIDLLSMNASFILEYAERVFNDPVAMFAAQNTRKLREVDCTSDDALFVPGGYGLLWDLASDGYTLKMTREFDRSDRPVAMAGHVPAILRDVKLSTGECLVNGIEEGGFVTGQIPASAPPLAKALRSRLAASRKRLVQHHAPAFDDTDTAAEK